MVGEELDKEDPSEGSQGLGGELDLYAAVGVFGRVEFEVCFAPDQWIYRLES
jgi:hypothetical protein